MTGLAVRPGPCKTTQPRLAPEVINSAVLASSMDPPLDVDAPSEPPIAPCGNADHANAQRDPGIRIARQKHGTQFDTLVL